MIEYSIDNLNLDTECNVKEFVEMLDKERKSALSGYYNLPFDSLECIKKCNLIKKSFKDDYDSIVVVGIGGSSLGAKAVYSALDDGLKKEIFFLENPDPIALKRDFDRLKHLNPVTVLISKSGTTIETISIFKAFIEELNIKVYKNSKVIVITDKDSPLDAFAKENFLTAFYIPKNVGGRFSVLSSVGIVPLTLADFDTKELLSGAKSFVDSFFSLKEPHVVKKAFFLAKNYKTLSTNVLFVYKSSLDEFTKWFVQLIGESLGKMDDSGNRVGITPIGLIGSIDQHSFLQLLVEGPKDKSVTIVKIKDFKSNLKIPDISLSHIQKCDFVNNIAFSELLNAECDATAQSLIESGVPTDMIVLNTLNEKSLGELIIYFEILTSLIGSILKIDTYNQPGVERGKKILYETFSSQGHTY